VTVGDTLGLAPSERVVVVDAGGEGAMVGVSLGEHEGMGGSAVAGELLSVATGMPVALALASGGPQGVIQAEEAWDRDGVADDVAVVPRDTLMQSVMRGMRGALPVPVGVPPPVPARSDMVVNGAMGTALGRAPCASATLAVALGEARRRALKVGVAPPV
jgi:hypothetical protein